LRSYWTIGPVLPALESEYTCLPSGDETAAELKCCNGSAPHPLEPAALKQLTGW
jgi:hypothetical protein